LPLHLRSLRVSSFFLLGLCFIFPLASRLRLSLSPLAQHCLKMVSSSFFAIGRLALPAVLLVQLVSATTLPIVDLGYEKHQAIEYDVSILSSTNHGQAREPQPFHSQPTTSTTSRTSAMPRPPQATFASARPRTPQPIEAPSKPAASDVSALKRSPTGR
jgi:hypothetical protein